MDIAHARCLSLCRILMQLWQDVVEDVLEENIANVHFHEVLFGIYMNMFKV